MPPSVSEKTQLVDEIVLALTGPAETEPPAVDLGDQMRRAAKEVDDRTAQAFAKALLDSLCEDPGNVRQLEALIVLGLAHPDALARRGISVDAEGRRLAVMLEHQGDRERAACLLELLRANSQGSVSTESALAEFTQQTSEGEALVEQYMQRAKTSARRGKTQEAVSWLQEVLLIDRSRRDVARMIRDLRYQDADRKARWRKFLRVSLCLTSTVAVVGSIAYREVSLHREWVALPNASPRTLPEMRARLASVEGMIADRRVWVGLPQALEERDELRQLLEEARLESEREQRQAELDREHDLRMAEAARLRGLMNVELGAWAEAVEDFRRCLSIADADWEYRDRVEADLRAVEGLLEGGK